MPAARTFSSADILLLSTAAARAEPLGWDHASLRQGVGKVVSRDSHGDSLSEEVTSSTERFGRIGADFGIFGAHLDLSYSLAEVKIVIESRRRHSNTKRPD